MMRLWEYWSFWAWRSVSFSCQRDHLCWRRLDFGFFFYYDFSSVFDHSLVFVPVVAFPSLEGFLLADGLLRDSWWCSWCCFPCDLVMLSERRFLGSFLLLFACGFSCLFHSSYLSSFFSSFGFGIVVGCVCFLLVWVVVNIGLWACFWILSVALVCLWPAAYNLAVGL